LARIQGDLDVLGIANIHQALAEILEVWWVHRFPLKDADGELIPNRLEPAQERIVEFWRGRRAGVRATPSRHAGW
jgi:hypothetical protein